jgi:hypothetical protein
MSFVRSALVAAAILGVVTSGVALAQTTTPSSSTSSKIDDVPTGHQSNGIVQRPSGERKKKNGPTARSSQRIRT